jgi:inosine-uridine nucleoside N-ribohydrolase
MKPILIDCDPGHDDMIAIMVAAVSAGLELLGITTVAGNQTGAKTYRNARRVLSLIGREDVPVRRGSDAPLLATLKVASDIHGESGLDGAELPEPTVPASDELALDFLRRTIREYDGRVTLVPTGPMTNIALLLKTEPALAEKIERIVFMGGGMALSNITPAAEFNIYTDPEAAQIVFTSGIPLTMIGLDVTHQAVMSLETIERLAAGGGRVSRRVGGLLQFYAGAYREHFAFEGAPIHDALAVAAAADPTIVTTRKLYGAVELAPGLSRGRTVIDINGVTGREANIDVALEVDSERFLKVIMETLRYLDSQAP